MNQTSNLKLYLILVQALEWQCGKTGQCSFITIIIVLIFCSQPFPSFNASIHLQLGNLKSILFLGQRMRNGETQIMQEYQCVDVSPDMIDVAQNLLGG